MTIPNAPTDALGALGASALGAELTEAQARTLAERLTLHDLAEGEVLVREGTRDDRLYAIVSGSLAATRNAGTREEVQLFTLVAGDTVGELSFLDDHVHSASFVARKPTRVFALPRADLEALLDSDPHIVYRVMRAIARRVHQLQHRLAAQAVELSNYIYKQGGRY